MSKKNHPLASMAGELRVLHHAVMSLFPENAQQGPVVWTKIHSAFLWGAFFEFPSLGVPPFLSSPLFIEGTKLVQKDYRHRLGTLVGKSQVVTTRVRFVIHFAHYSNKFIIWPQSYIF